MRRQGPPSSTNPYSYYNVSSNSSDIFKPPTPPPLLKRVIVGTTIGSGVLFLLFISCNVLSPACRESPLVISHRAAFPSSATKQGTRKDVSALLPPGSVKSGEDRRQFTNLSLYIPNDSKRRYHCILVALVPVAALASRGVCAFDVDVFSTADNVLVVGHPDEVRKRLHLNDAPTSLTLEGLRRKDGGQTATVSEFIEAAKDCKDSGADPKLSGGGSQAKLRLLFELKGDSATPHSLQSISESAKAAGVGISETGVWVQEVR